MSSTRRVGPVFVVIAALLWSLDGLLRVKLYSLPAPTIVLFEHLLGLIVLLPLAGWWWKEVRQLTLRDWLVMSVVGLFSGALGTMFYTQALKNINYLPYSIVVLLQQQLQPIWAILAARIFLKEKINRAFIGWASVALVAAYVITFPNLQVNLSTGEGTVVAGFFAVAAGVMWGSSTALSKLVLTNVSFLTAVFLRFLLTPVFALLIVMATNQAPSLNQIAGDQWFSLLLITLSTGMVAVTFYYYGLKKTPARIATLCELVWPASAVLIDYLYFDKSLRMLQMLGILVLGFAIFNITKKAPRL